MSRSQKITLCHGWPSDCSYIFLILYKTEYPKKKKNLTVQCLEENLRWWGGV